MPTPPGQPVLRCLIELRKVEPVVWRLLLVPGSVRLDKFHRMIQVAMGWEDSHLHSFEIAGVRYGMHADVYPEDELDEKSATVIAAVGTTERFAYEYDFGDSWEHDVTVQAQWRQPIGLKFGVCLDGANACPPEDSGGPFGYKHLLQVVNDASHPEHEDLRDWLGADFDPRRFDLGLANASLQTLR